MSEQEPNQERQVKRYVIEYNGNKYVLGPDNTVLYIHTDHTKYDHFYVQLDDDEDGEQVGHYEWRETYRQLDKEAEFNEKIENLAAQGCQPVLKREVSDFDKRQFHARFGEELDTEPTSVEKPATAPENAPEFDWISPRQERVIKNAVGFLIYLAEKGKL